MRWHVLRYEYEGRIEIGLSHEDSVELFERWGWERSGYGSFTMRGAMALVASLRKFEEALK